MTLLDHRTAAHPKTRMLWIDLTRRCQLGCSHCLNDSGAHGTHGTMSRADWTGVLTEAASLGVQWVQFFGGEPTLHPDGPALVSHAVRLGLKVEIYTNLVHVSDAWWDLFGLPRVSVATSYYSDRAAEHDRITGRPTHSRTRQNIIKAIGLGVSLRVGIVAVLDGQRTGEARAELAALGVTDIRIDRVRPYGRARLDGRGGPSGLCRGCGEGRAAIAPDGGVSPCVFASRMTVGDVRVDGLTSVLLGEEMSEANARIRESVKAAALHAPDDDDEEENDTECSPGFPLSSDPARR